MLGASFFASAFAVLATTRHKRAATFSRIPSFLPTNFLITILPQSKSILVFLLSWPLNWSPWSPWSPCFLWSPWSLWSLWYLRSLWSLWSLWSHFGSTCRKFSASNGKRQYTICLLFLRVFPPSPAGDLSPVLRPVSNLERRNSL